MRFTKTEVQNYGQELQDILKAFAEERGLVYNRGNIRYGDDFSTKITFMKKSVDNATGKQETKESKDFLTNCFRINIPKQLLFRKFRHNGQEIELTGYKTRSSKYPITYKKDGQPYKCTPTFFNTMAEKSASEFYI